MRYSNFTNNTNVGHIYIEALSLDMEWVTSLQLGGLEVATVVKFTISGHERQLMFKGQ